MEKTLDIVLRAEFSPVDLDFPMFDYLDQSERHDLLSNKINLCQANFFDGTQHEFSVIFERFPDTLHVRELAGGFVKYRRLLSNFCIDIARAMKLKKVTAVTNSQAIAYSYIKLGWKKDNNFSNEYYYEV